MMTVADVSIRSYAIGRANPFLEVLQVVEANAGKTSSANRLSWLMVIFSGLHRHC